MSYRLSQDLQSITCLVTFPTGRWLAKLTSSKTNVNAFIYLNMIKLNDTVHYKNAATLDFRGEKGNGIGIGKGNAAHTSSNQSPCNICGLAQYEDNNEMLCCSRCNCIVHQGCYGICEPPEYWVCALCVFQSRQENKAGNKLQDSGHVHSGNVNHSLGAEGNVVCTLCKKPGGAMRRGSEKLWIHSCCVLFCKSGPYFKDHINLDEPCEIKNSLHLAEVMNWKCVSCDVGGFPIPCSYPGCNVRTHVTCSRDFGGQTTIQQLNVEIDGIMNTYIWKAVFCTSHGDQESLIKASKAEKNRLINETRGLCKNYKDSEGISTEKDGKSFGFQKRKAWDSRKNDDKLKTAGKQTSVQQQFPSQNNDFESASNYSNNNKSIKLQWHRYDPFFKKLPIGRSAKEILEGTPVEERHGLENEGKIIESILTSHIFPPSLESFDTPLDDKVEGIEHVKSIFRDILMNSERSENSISTLLTILIDFGPFCAWGALETKADSNEQESSSKLVTPGVDVEKSNTIDYENLRLRLKYFTFLSYYQLLYCRNRLEKVYVYPFNSFQVSPANITARKPENKENEVTSSTRQQHSKIEENGEYNKQDLNIEHVGGLRWIIDSPVNGGDQKKGSAGDDFATLQIRQFLKVFSTVQADLSKIKGHILDSILEENSYKHRISENYFKRNNLIARHTAYTRWKSIITNMKLGICDQIPIQRTKVIDRDRVSPKKLQVEEESKKYCAVCFLDIQCTRSFALTCARCYVTVHKQCYGLSTCADDSEYVDWYCTRCVFERRMTSNTGVDQFQPASVRCYVCGRYGGAFKNMANGINWIHLFCAITIMPKSYCGNLVELDLWGIKDIYLNSGNQLCSICHRTGGVVITCSAEGCNTTYHSKCCWLRGCRVWVERTKNCIKYENVNSIGFPEIVTKSVCFKHMYTKSLDRSTMLQRYLRNRKIVNRDLKPEKYQTAGKDKSKSSRKSSHPFKRQSLPNSTYMEPSLVQNPSGIQAPDYYYDFKCSICFKSDNETTIGKIVHCVNCALCVHAGCYGSEMSGDFVCNTCRMGKLPENVACLLCSRRGGALRTYEGIKISGNDKDVYVHVICALYAKSLEIKLSLNEKLFTMVGGFELAEIMTHTCQVCGFNYGYVVECYGKDCKTYVHPICGFINGYPVAISYSEPTGIDVIVFCKQSCSESHSPKLTVNYLPITVMISLLQLLRNRSSEYLNYHLTKVGSSFTLVSSAEECQGCDSAIAIFKEPFTFSLFAEEISVYSTKNVSIKEEFTEENYYQYNDFTTMNSKDATYENIIPVKQDDSMAPCIETEVKREIKRTRQATEYPNSLNAMSPTITPINQWFNDLSVSFGAFYGDEKDLGEVNQRVLKGLRMFKYGFEVDEKQSAQVGDLSTRRPILANLFQIQKNKIIYYWMMEKARMKGYRSWYEFEKDFRYQLLTAPTNGVKTVPTEPSPARASKRSMVELLRLWKPPDKKKGRPGVLLSGIWQWLIGDYVTVPTGYEIPDFNQKLLGKKLHIYWDHTRTWEAAYVVQSDHQPGKYGDSVVTFKDGTRGWIDLRHETIALIERDAPELNIIPTTSLPERSDVPVLSHHCHVCLKRINDMGGRFYQCKNLACQSFLCKSCSQAATGTLQSIATADNSWLENNLCLHCNNKCLSSAHCKKATRITKARHE